MLPSLFLFWTFGPYGLMQSYVPWVMQLGGFAPGKVLKL